MKTDNFLKFYKNYLSVSGGCSNLKPMNYHSVCDYILRSGNTGNVIIEYKDRSTKSVKDFYDCIIEKTKYDNLMTLSRLLDCHSLYVVTYSDCVLVWHLKRDHNYVEDLIPMQKTNVTDSEKVLKPVYKLMFDQASIIYATRTNTRASLEQLNIYRTLE